MAPPIAALAAKSIGRHALGAIANRSRSRTCLLGCGCPIVAALTLATAGLVPALFVVVNPPAVAASTAPFVPVTCQGLRVSQGFGNTPFEHPHAGIDLVCPGGTPVHAVVAGVFRQRWGGAGRCAYPSWAVGGLGLYGEVDTGDIQYLYGHLEAVAIAGGTPVAAGTILGYEGSTGCSTGAHLHFEVRIAGHATNPCAFLPAGYPAVHVPSSERCWGAAPP